MRTMFVRHCAIIATVVVALSFASLGTGHGQEAPTLQPERPITQPLLPMQAALPAALPAQSATQTYLPLMIASYSAIQFSTSVDANGAPVSPATSFGYGIKDLFFSTLVGGLDDVSYKLTITAPDGKQLSETFSANPKRYYAGFQICLTTGIDCSSGSKSALPRGSYKAQLYANDILVREDAAVIQ